MKNKIGIGIIFLLALIIGIALLLPSPGEQSYFPQKGTITLKESIEAPGTHIWYCVRCSDGTPGKNSMILSAFIFENGKLANSYITYDDDKSVFGDNYSFLRLGDCAEMTDGEIIRYLEDNYPTYNECMDFWGSDRLSGEYRFMLETDSSGNVPVKENIAFLIEGNDNLIKTTFGGYQIETLYPIYNSMYDGLKEATYIYFLTRSNSSMRIVLDSTKTTGIYVDGKPNNAMTYTVPDKVEYHKVDN